MAIYAYGAQQIECIVGEKRRTRIRFVIAGLVTFAVALLLAIYFPGLPIFHEPLRAWLLALLISGILAPLARIIWNWRSCPDRARTSLRETKVEITTESVTISGPFGYRTQLNTRDIARAEESSLGTGLYLRTVNRYRWILVPRRIEGYESLKGELRQMSIPGARILFLPNWEEFVGALLFIATILCSVIAHSRQILIGNLFVSVLLAIAGFLVIGANPNNPKIRSARIGIFIPVVFAALGLWLAPGR